MPFQPSLPILIAEMIEPFKDMLTGGHSNSLGRTIEVVDCVLADHDRFAELFDCYQSSDEVVRLRTSNAMKRVAAEHLELLVPYIDRLINDIGELDQASAQWTLAQLFQALENEMTPDQKARACSLIKRNLENHQDWIVLNRSIETLSKWAAEEPSLKAWLMPQLERLAQEKRKSIARRATRALQEFRR